MRKTRVRSVVPGFLLTLCIASPVLGQGRGRALDSTEEAKIAKMLSDSGAPSVSIAIVEQDELAYAKAFGKASLDPSRGADEYTRYAVGSISKQFTVAAILLAAQDGRLSLDDKVSEYFPEGLRPRSDGVPERKNLRSSRNDHRRRLQCR